jgi:hypothetical protein
VAGVVTTISDGDDLRARDGGCTTAWWTGAGSGSATAGSRGGATSIASSSEARPSGSALADQAARMGGKRLGSMARPARGVEIVQ